MDGLDDGRLGGNRNHLRRHDLVGTHLSVSRPVAQTVESDVSCK
jgi:hypothetical protein